MMTPKQATRYFAAKLNGRPSELTEARYARCKTTIDPSGSHDNLSLEPQRDQTFNGESDTRFSWGSFLGPMVRPGRLVNGGNSKRTTLRTHRAGR